MVYDNNNMRMVVKLVHFNAIIHHARNLLKKVRQLPLPIPLLLPLLDIILIDARATLQRATPLPHSDCFPCSIFLPFPPSLLLLSSQSSFFFPVMSLTICFMALVAALGPLMSSRRSAHCSSRNLACLPPTKISLLFVTFFSFST